MVKNNFLSKIFSRFSKNEYVQDINDSMSAKLESVTPEIKKGKDSLYSFVKPGLMMGAIIIMIAVLVFLVWGGLAPLDSAAIAEGTVVLSGKHKTIQHLEGGVIEQINIKEGDLVKQGDVLINLNQTSAKTRLAVIESQMMQAQAIDARLSAEQAYADSLDFSQLKKHDNYERVTQAQQGLFKSRKAVLEGQISILKEKILQSEEHLIGLNARKESLESQAKLLQEEIENIEVLFKKGLALKPRVLELKRQYDSALGSLAEIKASIATTKESIAETNLQILNTKDEFQQKVTVEHKDNLNNLLELTEQLNAARDILDRTEIRAPDDGIITDLQFFTIGGVIPPGAKILDIVPQNDILLVEAKVKTQDIDSLKLGIEAKVQLNAYKSRLLPRLTGQVVYISADIITDPTNGMPYYVARVEIDSAQLSNVNLDVKLYPGMPASVFLVKGTRTFLQYLISPIRDSLFRAFKEV